MRNHEAVDLAVFYEGGREFEELVRQKKRMVLEMRGGFVRGLQLVHRGLEPLMGDGAREIRLRFRQISEPAAGGVEHQDLGGCWR